MTLERDPEMCSAEPCDKEATAATHAGPLCNEHAAQLARITEGW